MSRRLFWPPTPVAIAWALAAYLSVVLLGAAFVYFGVYNVSALDQHTPPVYELLHKAMLRSVSVRARDIHPPSLDRSDLLAGQRLFEKNCQRCHGAPGVAPESFSLGMTPGPPAIASIASTRNGKDIFWTIRNGIKMTGMPAWGYRMTEREIWQTVAFVKLVPSLTVVDYRKLRQEAATASIERKQPRGSGTAELASGRVALHQYNCVSCHLIPGVTGGNNYVGPTLAGMGSRSFIAGVLPNSDANLMRWIREPEEVSPQTAMPDLDVSKEHAKLMIDYLHTLKEVP